jgi:hypothetical protein
MTDFRCDRATIKHWEDTPEGFLRFTAPVGREGVLTYANRDGSVRREHVSLDVLKSSADSLKIKPITTPGHPPGLINKDTAKPYLAGSTGNSVWLDSGFLWVTGTVFDGETIDSIKSGRTKELSLGYGVDTVARADGDFDQIKRHVNHLSPVTSARASGAGFKLDGDDEALVSLDAIDAEFVVPKKVKEKSKEKKAMPFKATLDGFDFEFETRDEAQHLKAVEKELSKLRADSASTKEKLDAATIALDEAKTELSTVKAEIVTQKTALDAAETEVKTAKEDRLDEDAINTLISDRMKLWQEVLPMMRSDNADFEPDYSLAPLGIMAAAVKVANPDIATHLDGLDLSDSENSGFVKGLYAGLNTKQYSQASATRSDANTLLAEIRANRFDMATGGKGGKNPMDAEKSLEEARKKRAERIAAANKK